MNSKNLAFILVRPQMGENIGASARAMLNCGFTELRLVSPRDGWPNERAFASASAADSVLQSLKLFDTVADAVADCHYVLATTARARDQAKPVFTPVTAASEFQQRTDQYCAVMFGPERTGLENDDLVHANGLITIPLNPDYSSLNLAQAVLLIGWEYRKLFDQTIPDALKKSPAATKDELENFFVRLETELQLVGFYTTPEIKPSMVRNVRNLFQRAELTEQEVRTLHGIVTALKN